MPPSRVNAYNLVPCPRSTESDQIKNVKATYRRKQYYEFRKNRVSSLPLKGKFIEKIQILTVSELLLSFFV